MNRYWFTRSLQTLLLYVRSSFLLLFKGSRHGVCSKFRYHYQRDAPSPPKGQGQWKGQVHWNYRISSRKFQVCTMTRDKVILSFLSVAEHVLLKTRSSRYDVVCPSISQSRGQSDMIYASALLYWMCLKCVLWEVVYSILPEFGSVPNPTRNE